MYFDEQLSFAQWFKLAGIKNDLTDRHLQCVCHRASGRGEIAAIGAAIEVFQLSVVLLCIIAVYVCD